MESAERTKIAYKAFVKFMANPYKTKTLAEFAKEDLGYKSMTPINDFKEKPGFWDEVWDKFVNHYLQGELPDVNKALIDGAKKGDTEKMKVIYKMANKIKDEQEKNKGPEIKLIIEK